MNKPEFPVSLLDAAADERVAVVPGSARWMRSTVPGVDRMPLDPAGDESGRFTGFLRFARGSRLPEREPTAGEEMLVLAGHLSDERGRHRAGTYLRNPPGSSPALHSPSGCTLFVKLGQFPAGDLGSHLVDTRRRRWARESSDQASEMPLHFFGTECTRLLHWRAGIGGAPVQHPGGAEIVVLDGDFADEHGSYPSGTWMRLPAGAWHRPRAGRRGVLVWMKAGHLPAASTDLDVPDRTAEAVA